MILDPFGGAATTALAAMELGRDCIIVERKAEYLAIGRERVAAWRPRTAKKPRARVARESGQPQLFEVA